jgi:hypothetical protein
MDTGVTKKERYAHNKQIMDKCCLDLGVTATEYYSKSFRLKKDGHITIDFFPMSSKCFFHDVQEWCIVEDVESFFNFQFSCK